MGVETGENRAANIGQALGQSVEGLLERIGEAVAQSMARGLLMTDRSEDVRELVAALVSARGGYRKLLRTAEAEIKRGKKYTYATLEAAIQATDEPLQENGITVVNQFMPHPNPKFLYVVTELIHASGQFLRSWLPMNTGDGSPHALGSAITYGKKYNLIALLNLAAVDDDGHGAQGGANPVKPKERRDEPSPKQEPVAPADPPKWAQCWQSMRELIVSTAASSSDHGSR